jgi:hypothetical protein
MARGHEPRLALRCRRADAHRARCRALRLPVRVCGGLRHDREPRGARVRRAPPDPRARGAFRLARSAGRAAGFLPGRGRAVGRLDPGGSRPGRAGAPSRRVDRRGPDSREPHARPRVGPGLAGARRRDSIGGGDARDPRPLGSRGRARAPPDTRGPPRGRRAPGSGAWLGARKNRSGSVGARRRPRGGLGAARLRFRRNAHRGPGGHRPQRKTAARVTGAG